MKRDSSSYPPTIIAIRLRLLGDVLATLGTLRALKRSAPDHRIVFVVDSHYHDLLKNTKYIDSLFPQPPRIDGFNGALAYGQYIDDLRNLYATHALDFHSNTRSALLSYLTGAPVRVGFDVRIRKMLYTDVEPRARFEDGHPVARTSHESAMALVRRSGFTSVNGPADRTITVRGADAIAGRHVLVESGIAPKVIDSGRLVGLNAGNPYPAKAWAVENWIELTGMLTGSGREVVVFWGPGEKGVAKDIVRRSVGSVYLLPALPLNALPGVLNSVAQLVTIDSGLKHLAVAVGVPTVTLFGPTSPFEWHMGGDRDRFLYEDLSCSPCRLLECHIGQPCMTQITPQRVFETIQSAEVSGVDT
ncbi:MAG: glycosyltransferase family 9 protein [Candidatus Latescibacterota bacterium]|nr:MAG: glycosyltransferase family 9 protein [Candidatus Latescibacterota bacterium]